MNGSAMPAREPQIREWTNRLGSLSEQVLASQQELSQRLSPILRNDPMPGEALRDSKEVELVPAASVLRDICRMAERAIAENQRMIQMLEL